MHRGPFDCQLFFNRDARPAAWFCNAEESLDELDEVHSQL